MEADRPRSASFLRACLLAFFLPLALLPAKEKEPVIPPSFAKPVQATIFLGDTVEIPLIANAPVRGTRYLLRSQPRKGQLEEIVTTDSGRASVVYRNDSRNGTGTDTFTYAVQSPGAAVSSRATATVKVINRPPHLETPEETDFGNVPVGSTARRTLTLVNSGGEPFVSHIQLASPWKCEVGRLEIPPGKSKDILLEFSPDFARTFSGEWFLSGVGGTGVRLIGTGYIVFDVLPSLVNLQVLPEGRRSGKFTVANKTDERLEVSFACPERILPISPQQIEGGGEVEVNVEADAAHPSGGNSSVTVSEKRTSKTVEILIPPLPAKLSTIPSFLDFGEIQAGKSAAREITISNSGGLPAALEISCPSWILPEATRFLVKPGEDRKLRLEAVAARPAMLRDRMLIKCGSTAIDFPVSLTVPAGGLSSSPAPRQAPEKPASAAVHFPLRITRIAQDKGMVTVCWQDPNPDRRTYRMDSLRLTSEASLARQAAIESDVGSEKFSAEEFAAERLRFSKIFEQASKNDKVVKIWSPLENLHLRESENAMFEATFPAQPNAPVMRIRISSVLADGSSLPVQTEIRIPLKQPPPRSWPVKTILLSLVALAALAVLIWKKMEAGRPQPPR